MTALEISALHAAKRPRDRMRGDAGFGDLAADCAARLRVRLARPQRAPGDWSIELPAGGCACDLCDTLRAFLSDKSRRTFQWPLAQQRRQHIHSRIDAAELPVSHVTRRQGRPYTLVLSKTDALFARERRRGSGINQIWSGLRQSGLPVPSRKVLVGDQPHLTTQRVEPIAGQRRHRQSLWSLH